MLSSQLSGRNKSQTIKKYRAYVLVWMHGWSGIRYPAEIISWPQEARVPDP